LIVPDPPSRSALRRDKSGPTFFVVFALFALFALFACFVVKVCE
jgi:hypothetical protein